MITLPWRADHQLADAVQHTTGLAWWWQLAGILAGVAGYRFVSKRRAKKAAR